MFELYVLADFLLEWRLQVELTNMVAYCSIFILMKSSSERLEFRISEV